MNLESLLEAFQRADEYQAMVIARRRASDRARRAHKAAASAAAARAAAARAVLRRASIRRTRNAAERPYEPAPCAPHDEAYGLALATEGGAL